MVTCSKNASAPDTIISANSTPFKKFMFFNWVRPLLFFKMLLVFNKIFDKMNDVDKRKLIESMIAEVHLHPKETWEAEKNPIKEIKYAFPVSKEVMDALRENVASVETVCLLSKKAQ